MLRYNKTLCSGITNRLFQNQRIMITHEDKQLQMLDTISIVKNLIIIAKNNTH